MPLPSTDVGQRREEDIDFRSFKRDKEAACRVECSHCCGSGLSSHLSVVEIRWIERPKSSKLYLTKR
jgi:hypothetical protein